MAATFIVSRRRLSTAATISAGTVSSKLKKALDPDEALAVLSSVSPSAFPSRYAIDITVRRLAKSGRFDEIDSLLQSRRLRSNEDERFLSGLIHTYGGVAMTANALQLFDEIPQPTATSFNAILSAHIRAKKPDQVPQLFAELPAKHSSIVPDQMSYGILINSLCHCGEIDKALEAFNEMKVKNIEPNIIVYTTLIGYFYKKTRPEEANKLWEEMVGKGIKPDVMAYTAKIMCPATNGKPEEVLAVMKEMEANGLKPDVITYNYLINSYCKNERFEDAKETYRGFLKKTKGAKGVVFKTLVQALCRHGDFDGALKVARDGMKRNKTPEFNTMKVLVEWLVNSGKVEEAKEVIGVIKERFPGGSLSKWKGLEKQLGLNVDGEEKEEGLTVNDA